MKNLFIFLSIAIVGLLSTLTQGMDITREDDDTSSTAIVKMHETHEDDDTSSTAIVKMHKVLPDNSLEYIYGETNDKIRSAIALKPLEELVKLYPDLIKTRDLPKNCRWDDRCLDYVFSQLGHDRDKHGQVTSSVLQGLLSSSFVRVVPPERPQKGDLAIYFDRKINWPVHYALCESDDKFDNKFDVFFASKFGGEPYVVIHKPFCVPNGSGTYGNFIEFHRPQPNLIATVIELREKALEECRKVLQEYNRNKQKV